MDLYCVDCGGVLNGSYCKNCKQIFPTINGIPRMISPKDTSNGLFQRYMNNYNTIAEDDAKEEILPASYRKSQMEWTLKYCPVSDSVLDIGAGRGELLQAVKSGYKVAVDIANQYLTQLVNSNIYSIQANAERLPFRNEFDLVVITDVLEHVFNPMMVLYSAWKSMVDKGTLVVRVPLNEDIRIYEKSKYEFVHLQSYSSGTLKGMLKEVKFEVRGIHYGGFIPSRMRTLFTPLRLFLSAMVKLGLKNEHLENMFSRMPEKLGYILCRPIEILVVGKKNS